MEDRVKVDGSGVEGKVVGKLGLDNFLVELDRTSRCVWKKEKDLTVIKGCESDV
ncbi:MAG: hypothetical protein ACOCRX_07525 [Candidatus Woesearchaeota archaeon]